MSIWETVPSPCLTSTGSRTVSCAVGCTVCAVVSGVVSGGVSVWRAAMLSTIPGTTKPMTAAIRISFANVLIGIPPGDMVAQREERMLSEHTQRNAVRRQSLRTAFGG